MKAVIVLTSGASINIDDNDIVTTLQGKQLKDEELLQHVMVEHSGNDIIHLSHLTVDHDLIKYVIPREKISWAYLHAKGANE